MDLNAYLPYFKSMIDRKIGWTISNPEDGIVRVGYPLYDKPMLEFSSFVPVRNMTPITARL